MHIQKYRKKSQTAKLKMREFSLNPILQAAAEWRLVVCKICEMYTDRKVDYRFSFHSHTHEFNSTLPSLFIIKSIFSFYGHLLSILDVITCEFLFICCVNLKFRFSWAANWGGMALRMAIFEGYLIKRCLNWVMVIFALF